LQRETGLTSPIRPNFRSSALRGVFYRHLDDDGKLTG